jgi:hypothetical protein
MEKYHIQLTPTEAATLKKIDLRVSHRNHDEGRATYLANERPILELLRSLSDRKAVPQERLNFWNDPSYRKGRMKESHKSLFERNGRHGAEIYTHPHLIPYLRYIPFGADLPDVVISAFQAKVGNPAWVTSGDIVPIGKCARDLVRQHHLDVADAAQEFFKLCLDMGLGLSIADSVMRSVRQIR